MKKLPFEDIDFSGMAQGIKAPPEVSPLPKEKSSLASDVLDVVKTGIQTYGEVKKAQMDSRRKAEINTINAMKTAFDLAGIGVKVTPEMLGGLVSPEQAEAIYQKAQEGKGPKEPSDIELYRAGLPSKYGQKSPTPKNPMRITDSSYRQVMYNPETGTSVYARDPQGNILHSPPPPSGNSAADQATARRVALADKYQKILVKSVAQKDEFGFAKVDAEGNPQYTDIWNEKQYQVLMKTPLTTEERQLIDNMRAQYYTQSGSGNSPDDAK